MGDMQVAIRTAVAGAALAVPALRMPATRLVAGLYLVRGKASAGDCHRGAVAAEVLTGQDGVAVGQVA